MAVFIIKDTKEPHVVQCICSPNHTAAVGPRHSAIICRLHEWLLACTSNITGYRITLRSCDSINENAGPRHPAENTLATVMVTLSRRMTLSQITAAVTGTRQPKAIQTVALQDVQKRSNHSSHFRILYMVSHLNYAESTCTFYVARFRTFAFSHFAFYTILVYCTMLMRQ